jgi:hypothetical protein
MHSEKGWQYFRFFFAAVDDDVMEIYGKGVVEASRSKDKVSDIDDILKDEGIALLGATQLSTCQVSHRRGNDGPAMHFSLSLEQHS